MLATSLLPGSPTSTFAPHLFTRVSSCPLMCSRSAGGMSGGLEETGQSAGRFHGNCPLARLAFVHSASLMCGGDSLVGL